MPLLLPFLVAATPVAVPARPLMAPPSAFTAPFSAPAGAFSGGNQVPLPSPLARPLPTVTTARGGAFGLAYLLPQHGGGKLRPITEPAPTVATGGAIALIIEYYGKIGRASCRERV
jgi:hypothetical protein